jgi:hypothetical protein
MKRFLWMSVLVAFACVPDGRGDDDAPPASMSRAEEVVQGQLEAYNRRDVEAFASFYADDVNMYAYPDELIGSGIEGLRRDYEEFFAATPDLHAEITNRIVQGAFVIDHERVTGGGEELSAVAIYEVEGWKIVNVWFIF